MGIIFFKAKFRFESSRSSQEENTSYLPFLYQLIHVFIYMPIMISSFSIFPAGVKIAGKWLRFRWSLLTSFPFLCFFYIYIHNFRVNLFFLLFLYLVYFWAIGVKCDIFGETLRVFLLKCKKSLNSLHSASHKDIHWLVISLFTLLIQWLSL